MKNTEKFLTNTFAMLGEINLYSKEYNLQLNNKNKKRRKRYSVILLGDRILVTLAEDGILEGTC